MNDLRRRILIVEDDEDIRSTLAELLDAEGYDVQIAANGREALEQLQSEPLPALILLDLMMPELDGFQFVAEQKKDARLAHLPVVLMSAAGDLTPEIQALGARCYLKKPFKDIESILSSVAPFF